MNKTLALLHGSIPADIDKEKPQDYQIACDVVDSIMHYELKKVEVEGPL